MCVEGGGTRSTALFRRNTHVLRTQQGDYIYMHIYIGFRVRVTLGLRVHPRERGRESDVCMGMCVRICIVHAFDYTSFSP